MITRTGERGHVLFVEDDPMFARDLLKAWQPPVGIRWVRSTREALVALSEGIPSMVVLDIHLPPDLADVEEEEGLALLRQMKARMPVTPIVVVTRDASVGIRTRALDLGAAAVMTKPVDVSELERRIVGLVGGGQRERRAPAGA